MLIILQEDEIPHSLCYARIRKLDGAASCEYGAEIRNSEKYRLDQFKRADKSIILLISFQLPEPLTEMMAHNFYFQENPRGNNLAQVELKERESGKSASVEVYFHVTTSAVSSCAKKYT